MYVIRREKESGVRGGGRDRQERGEGSKVKRKGRVGYVAVHYKS